jgi:alpha-1,3-rhamnosyl/mannosyltransferase
MNVGLFAIETGRAVGGLETYEVELIRAIAAVDHNNRYKVYTLSRDVPELIGVRQENFEYVVLEKGRFRGVAYSAPKAMQEGQLDLFHALFVPPPFVSVPYVFTYHGTEAIERPDFYPRLLGMRMRFLFRRAFAKAAAIICVSGYVKDRLVASGLSPERLYAVPLASRKDMTKVAKPQAAKAVRELYGLERPFFLCVGRIEPRKNPVTTLRAYAKFCETESPPPALVFAGDKTWSAADFDRTVRKLRLEGKVLSLGHVANPGLLYCAAEAMVFASLWEGFGLPIIEAFASGCPVITSNTTSMPEVAADCALIVDPCSIDEIARAMTLMHGDADLRHRLSQKGMRRAREFSWRATAEATIAVYRKIAVRREGPSAIAAR